MTHLRRRALLAVYLLNLSAKSGPANDEILPGMYELINSLSLYDTATDSCDDSLFLSKFVWQIAENNKTRLHLYMGGL